MCDSEGLAMCCSHTDLKCKAVAHHVAVEPPLLDEQLLKRPLACTRRHAVHGGICTHDLTNKTLAFDESKTVFEWERFWW